MKKFLAILVSMMLVLSLSVFAFAEGGTPTPDTDQPYDAANGGFSITIDNALKGETYNAYKIFDVIYANDVNPAPTVTAPTTIPGAADDTHFHSNYAYTISNTSPWFSIVTAAMNSTYAAASTADGVISVNGLTFTPSQADPTVYAVAVDEDAAKEFKADEFAAYLSENLGTLTADGTVTPSGNVAYHENTDVANSDDPDAPHHNEANNLDNNVGSVTISDLDAGYYFVTTSLGTICSLDTTEPVAHIREKNDVPYICKEVSDDDEGPWSKRTDIDIGDDAWFRITVVDGKATSLPITVHDELDSQLTLDPNSFTVKVYQKAEGATEYTATTLTAGEDTYTLTTSGLTDSCTFEILIADDIVAAMNDGDYVEIIYSAQLNENAKIYKTEHQENDAWLTYANQTSVVHTVEVYTYAFDIIKTDSNDNVLQGAEFTLSDGTNTLAFVYDATNNYYRPAVNASETTTTTLVSGADGLIHIHGIDGGDYLLTETKAPTGYNMVKDPVHIYVSPLTKEDKDQTEFPYGDQYPTQETRKVATTTGDAFQDATFTTPWTADLSSNASLSAEQQSLANTVEVVNNTGSELPSTGGIGTTIFYIVGAVLVLGAAIILIAKRRSAAAEA